MFSVIVPHKVPSTQRMARGLGATPASNNGIVQAKIMAHVARQHCGSGDVELDMQKTLVPTSHVCTSLFLRRCTET